MVDLTKGKMALPTAFTLTSVLFGMLCIIWAPDQAHWSAVAIAFAALCDSLDGRVARLTKTESDFGVQIDSLADAISFGLAPGFLIYVWALSDLSWGGFDAGLAIAFVYVACGIIRLARFNVTASQPSSAKSFTGIPIPLAAIMLGGLVLTSHETGAITVHRVAIVVPVMLGLSVLMVSNIRFPSFKQLRSRRELAGVAALAIVALLLIAFTTLGILMIAVGAVYVALGILPALVRLATRSHRP